MRGYSTAESFESCYRHQSPPILMWWGKCKYPRCLADLFIALPVARIACLSMGQRRFFAYVKGPFHAYDPDEVSPPSFSVGCYFFFDLGARQDKCFSTYIRLIVIVAKCQDSSFSESDCSHVRKGLHEHSVARDHNKAAFAAVVKYPGISLGLLVDFVVNSNIQPRISQLFREKNRPQVSVEKIAIFTLPSLSGSI